MSIPRERGRFLTVMAIGLGLLAVSNFTKGFQYLGNPEVGGIVTFGVRAASFPSNLLVGSLMGVVLAAYAYGLWTLRAWVVPLSVAYAFYVPTNLVLFWFFQQSGDTPALGGLLVYLAVAFTGSIGTALYVASHRDKFA
jgi:hypothetical protein